MQNPMEQWVQRVRKYSSQYNDSTWAAHQVTGRPKVYPQYGDIHGAWAQSNPDANEYIEVSGKFYYFDCLFEPYS